MVSTRKLSPNLYATAYNEILDNYNLVATFREGPFLLLHANAPVHKARSIQNSQFDVEYIDWPAQRHLWDELELQL